MEKFGFGRPRHSHEHADRGESHPSRAVSNIPSTTLAVAQPPNASYVVSNVATVPTRTFPSGSYVILDDMFVLTVEESSLTEPGTIGLGGTMREWGQWSLRQPVTVAAYDIFANGNKRVYLGGITVEIDFYNKAKANATPYEEEVLAKRMISVFKNQIFSPGQKFAMEVAGINFRCQVRSTILVDLGTTLEAAEAASGAVVQNQRGILSSNTEVTFVKPAQGLMNLKASGNKPRANVILQPNFRFEDMGIGGLDEEFNIIFRRAFASRIYPPRDVERLGINHVKGMLLFGPPGTGKTLIARQIGKMLNAVEPKIVNGPEMLNKYVGGSEENIRNLFKDAEAEYKSKGEESNLHIIIFDELDAVFKQRGSRSDGTGVGDNVVNQLLAKMDGVDQLNNILVIGMTNRRDLIDSALLRPGRFEVQLEISLPDEKGRTQIFKIHTAKMKSAKALGKDVNLEELAHMTKNYSGAEIEGVVKSAASFALNRNIKNDPKKGMIFSKKDIVVGREDFLQALEETKPAFGVSEDDLASSIRSGIIKYSPAITDLLEQGDKLIRQVAESTQFPLVSVLVHGGPRSGKTALASSIALSSGFPFIRLVSPDAMIGMDERNRINYIQQMFTDSYRSPLNILVIDQIEDIIDYVNIGPRFSNSVLQALKVYIRKLPPPGHRLMVLATTGRRDVLEQMDLLSSFNKELYVPNVSNVRDLYPIFEELNFLDASSRQVAVEQVSKEVQSTVLGIGIKNIIFNVEAAKLSRGHELEEFVESTVRDINNKPGSTSRFSL